MRRALKNHAYRRDLIDVVEATLRLPSCNPSLAQWLASENHTHHNLGRTTLGFLFKKIRLSRGTMALNFEKSFAKGKISISSVFCKPT